MAHINNTNLAVKISIILLMLTGIVLRFIYLDADPKFYQWIGYHTDEGRWTDQARNLVLFDQFNYLPLQMMHLVIGSGFQFFSYLSFELFGIGFWSARLPSAIFGAGVLLAFFLVYRRYLSASACALGLVILAFDPDLLGLSRLAVPEASAMFFSSSEERRVGREWSFRGGP